MFETVTVCTCDKCQEQEQLENKEQIADKGWLIVADECFCPSCVNYYKSIKPAIGEQVVCLINDEKRHLIKGKVYTVCDALYNSSRSTVTDEDRDNIAIYVSCGNGWQAKLINTQYDV